MGKTVFLGFCAIAAMQIEKNNKIPFETTPKESRRENSSKCLTRNFQGLYVAACGVGGSLDQLAKSEECIKVRLIQVVPM